MQPAALKTQIGAMQERARQDTLEAEQTIAVALAQLAKIVEETQKNNDMKR